MIIPGNVVFVNDEAYEFTDIVQGKNKVYVGLHDKDTHLKLKSFTLNLDPKIKD